VRLQIAWGYPALTTLYALSPHEAAAVDRAVIHFAERGEGRLTRVGPYFRLEAGAHDAVVVIDRETWRMTVLRIYRARYRT